MKCIYFASVFQVDIRYKDNRTSMNLKWPNISADYDKGYGINVRCIIQNCTDWGHTNERTVHVARMFVLFSLLL